MPPGPEVLSDLLGRCDRLQDWARLQGFALEPVPEDLALLDEAIDRVIQEHGRHTRMSAIENEAGQFLGTVIVSTIESAHTGCCGLTGTRWCAWPPAVTLT